MSHKDVVNAITDTTLQQFKINAEVFATTLENIRQENKEFKDLHFRLKALIKKTQEFLTAYKNSERKLKKSVKKRWNQIDLESMLDEKSTGEIEVYENKLLQNDQIMAQKSVDLYIEIVQIFQKLGLFDPNAVIVIYDKNGNREEIPIKDATVTGGWKHHQKQKDNAGNTIAQLGDRCRITGKGLMDQLMLQHKNDNIYTRILSVRNLVQADYNNFKRLVEKQVFGIEYQENKESNKLVRIKNGQEFKSGLSIGGLIAEAFEIHYQQYIAQIWTVDEKNQSAHTLNSADGIKHYASNSQKLYEMLRNSSGSKPGYLATDQGLSQVKTDTATFMAISNLINMLRICEDIFCNKAGAKSAEEIVAEFEKEDSYAKFNGFAKQFVGEFAEMYQNSKK